MKEEVPTVEKAVLRIYDILGWIRIHAIFVIDLQDASKKLIFNLI
jgi:hypothetical protein